MKEEYIGKWECSEMVISTQRSGITSRVFDLGLIQKRMDGIEVTYELTGLGNSILKNSFKDEL